MATLLLHVDHTLMNTHSLFFLLGSFYPLETLELAEKQFQIQPDVPSQEWNDFTTRMDRAYRRFVKKVAHKELSRDPLCLFRPRTMEWLKEVNQRKQEGKIKEVILYTRSSYKGSCRFARDVIHTCIGISDSNDQLIKEVIDGTHISFYEEKEDVYWIHHDRMEGDQKDQKDQKDRSENRIHVPFYDFATSFDRLAELYFSSLREEKISLDALEEVVRWLYGPKGLKNKRNQTTPTTVYHFLAERTGQTAFFTSLPRQDDGWRAGERWLEQMDREEKWRERYPTWGKERKKESFLEDR